MRGALNIIAVAFLVAAVSLPATASAQRVTLKVDRTAITMDDEVFLEIRAEGEFDELADPPTPGFDVTGRSQSSQISIINGQMSRTQVLQRTLTPTSAGRHTIGPVRLLSRGSTVARSNTVDLTVREVSRAPMSARQASSLEAHAGESVFLLPEFPDRPVYVGEPFVLKYAMYVRNDVEVQGLNWKREPDLSGFSAEPLEIPRGRAKRKRIGRHRYAMAVQSQSLVVALKPGKVRVGPATMDVVVGDIFNRRRGKVRAPAFDLDVREPPATGRPEGYQRGTIGRFDLAVELRPTKVRAGERVVLTVRVSGRGALESLRPPALPTLEGAQVETLPSSDSDRVDKGPDGVSGTRVFQWVIVPGREGTLEIPALQLPYFDPDRGAYVIATTDPLSVEVEGSAPVAQPQAAPGATELVDGSLRDIRAESDLGSHRPQPFSEGLLFWLLLGVPALLVVLVEVVSAWRRWQARNAGRLRVRKARSTAGRRLDTAASQLEKGDTAAFFSEVAGALQTYCADRLGVSTRGATHGALRAELQARGADGALVNALLTELENCDFARFAPVDMREEEMRASLERTAELLSRLERLPAASGAPAGGMMTPGKGAA